MNNFYNDSHRFIESETDPNLQEEIRKGRTFILHLIVLHAILYYHKYLLL